MNTDLCNKVTYDLNISRLKSLSGQMTLAPNIYILHHKQLQGHSTTIIEKNQSNYLLI